MLVLTRNVGEEIVIGDDIVVTVLEVRGNRAKLGIDAPDTIRVRRSELPEGPPPSPSTDEPAAA